jgi:hypothetical protein
MRPWLALVVVVCTGCGTLNFAERKELFRVVSLDHSCNKDEIFVVSEETDREAGTGEYMLEACGKNRKYRREGDSYYDATARARDDLRRENSKRVLEASDIEIDDEAQDDELPPS